MIEGYYIRKTNWIRILDDAPVVKNILKKNVLVNYLSKIRTKVL